jgi:hypothetical protein
VALAGSLGCRAIATDQTVQGCSTLWNAEEVEEAIEAANGGAEAVLGE